MDPLFNMSYILEYPPETYAAMHGHTPSDYPDGSIPYIRDLMMRLNVTGHYNVGQGLATGSLPLSYWGPPDELPEEPQPSQAGPDADNRPVEDAVNRHLERGSNGINGHGRRRATRAARRPNVSAQQSSEDTTGAQGSPTTTRRRQPTAARRRRAANRGPAAVDIAPDQPLTMILPSADEQSGPAAGSSSSSMPDMPNTDGSHVLTPPRGFFSSSMLDVPSMDDNLTFGQPMEPSSPLPLTMPDTEWTPNPATESPSRSYLEMLGPDGAQQLLMGTGPQRRT
ncbi:MAG: hypothetical protein Q9176_008040 [Flavoplaca citrina]